jgi:TonB-dependent SusC/RagA subfamily outer membrane receptor
MPYIIQYLLKLSVSFAVVYLFYLLVLRRLTFYNWNRWYLLGYSLIAYCIPFINIDPFLEVNQLTGTRLVAFVPVINDLPVGERVDAVVSPTPVYNAWDIALFILLSGMLLMGARLLVQYISFCRIRRTALLLMPAPVKVYQVDKPIIPFSFGRSVFINRHQHSEEELKKIISHEFIHVKQKHTVDILWAEVLCMLNWYNPFVWMIRKAIRQNLEFIADNNVLENGIDKKEYQYLLLKVVGLSSFSITPQFNIVSLKKRIAMMNKIKSARIHLIRFLFILPMAAVLLLAFRNRQQQTQKAAPVTNVNIVQDTVPVKAKVKVVKKSTHNKQGYRITVADNDGECVVIVKDNTGKIVKAVQLTEWDKNKEQFERQYGEIPPAPPAAKDKIVISADTIFVNDAGTILIDASRNGPGNPYGFRASSSDTNVLFIIDGAPKTWRDVQNLPPEEIVEIAVEQDKDVAKIYGQKGKNGVIIVTTRKLQPNVMEGKTKAGVIIRDGDVVRSANVLKVGLDILYVVDGKNYSLSDFNELKLPVDKIESITVLKEKDAIAPYGEKGANGVIIITTKKEITTKEGPPFHFSAEQMKAVWEHARKENILYIGVENPLFIETEGVNPADLEVATDRGRITRKQGGFYCVPTLTGKSKVEVYKKQPDGKLTLLTTYQYTNTFFPPVPKIFELLIKG